MSSIFGIVLEKGSIERILTYSVEEVITLLESHSHKKARLDYIFGNYEGEDIINRFGWLETLLSDIQTIINGGKVFTGGLC